MESGNREELRQGGRGGEYRSGLQIEGAIDETNCRALATRETCAYTVFEAGGMNNLKGIVTKNYYAPRCVNGGCHYWCMYTYVSYNGKKNTRSADTLTIVLLVVMITYWN